MEIFDRIYYPAELSDWWMDDWISHIYGTNRTRKMDSIGIIHHSDEQKTRYDVDWTHGDSVQKLIREGQEKIEEWVREHN
jgi:hypothetical protein